jgi:hypothetical protein
MRPLSRSADIALRCIRSPMARRPSWWSCGGGASDGRGGRMVDSNDAPCPPFTSHGASIMRVRWAWRACRDAAAAIRSNPYRLATEAGLGFGAADRCAIHHDQNRIQHACEGRGIPVEREHCLINISPAMWQRGGGGGLGRRRGAALRRRHSLRAAPRPRQRRRLLPAAPAGMIESLCMHLPRHGDSIIVCDCCLPAAPAAARRRRHAAVHAHAR